MFNINQKKVIKEWVKETPKNLEKVHVLLDNILSKGSVLRGEGI